MVLKSDIEKSLNEQQRALRLFKPGVERYLLRNFKPHPSHIEVITGVRRSGKSTFIKQLLLKKYPGAVFFNFEDSRIYGFEVSDFPKLNELILPYPGAVFLDEIQNVSGWEVYVRQLHERGIKVFVTGSNASLLSRELGTRLTGRYVRHEVFPFSYAEFLRFTGKKDTQESFEQYLMHGGFPEYLSSGNPEILQLLLKDIVWRDIAVRHQVRSTRILMEMTLYLISNAGKETTFNSLRKAFGLGSANTVSDFLHWLEDAYLLFFLPRFSYKPKNIAVNPRKVYVVDNGLAMANSLSFSEDRGRLLENLVYLNLRRTFGELHYFREDKECDFVVMKQKKCLFLIQVCLELNGDNLHRETRGLKEAMDFFNMKEGYILTLKQKDKLKTENKTIHVTTVREFFKE